MKLRDYLDETKLSDEAFGAMVRLSKFGVRKLRYGERGPSVDVALRIEKATEGKVTVADLQKLPEAAAPRRPSPTSTEAAA